MNSIAPRFSLFSMLIVAVAIPAAATVTVSSPVNNSQVESPFALAAVASTCSSQTVGAMGYSLDSSTDTIIVDGTKVEAAVASAIGNHTLHIKAWGEEGSTCVEDVAITVIVGIPMYPLSATVNNNLQTLSNWKAADDTATGGGGASGIMSLVNTPSRSGNTRKFLTSYSKYSGERYNVSFGDDTTSTNFIYDGWLYLPSPSTSIANIEMDMKQVMKNGETVIFGVQCDGWAGTWDYTANTGTASKPNDEWLHSKVACNPRAWSTNTWHHVQISYSRDDSGNVTYKSVTLDGIESSINATVPSAFALGWSPTLLTNFQVDSYVAGSATSIVYLDDLTIYRW